MSHSWRIWKSWFLCREKAPTWRCQYKHLQYVKSRLRAPPIRHVTYDTRCTWKRTWINIYDIRITRNIHEIQIDVVLHAVYMELHRTFYDSHTYVTVCHFVYIQTLRIQPILNRTWRCSVFIVYEIVRDSIYMNTCHIQYVWTRTCRCITLNTCEIAHGSKHMKRIIFNKYKIVLDVVLHSIYIKSYATRCIRNRIRLHKYKMTTDVAFNSNTYEIVRDDSIYTWYSQLQIGWHSISTLFLKLFQRTRILPMGFTIITKQ